jgi:hypothetical protein
LQAFAGKKAPKASIFASFPTPVMKVIEGFLAAL